MANTDLRSRPSEVLSGSKDGKAELYPAEVVQNPFAHGSDQPKIENAFRTKDGDIIFSAGYDWYVMAKGSKDAYKIKELGLSEEWLDRNTVKLTVTLGTDVKGEHESTLNFDSKAGKASLGDAELSILSEGEKDALLKSSLSKEITFIGIPAVREVELAAKSPQGDYLVVSADKADYKYESLRMFKGKDLHSLHEIPVVDVIRYRDGGTTFYKTTEGTLYSPVHQDEAITWTPLDSKEHIKLDRLDENEVSQQIGTDNRIQGTETWKEYLESSKKPKGANNSDKAPQDKSESSLSSDMQKALDQYAKESKATSSSTAITSPPLQRNQLNSTSASIV